MDGSILSGWWGINRYWQGAECCLPYQYLHHVSTEGEREGRGENLQAGLFWMANPTRQRLLLESRRQCTGWFFVFVYLFLL